MFYHYFYPFAHKNQLFRKFNSDIGSVYIAINTFKRLERFKPVNDPFPKIAGVPDLITIFKMIKNGFIQVTMRIRH